jgi:hypothetical protein
VSATDWRPSTGRRPLVPLAALLAGLWVTNAAAVNVSLSPADSQRALRLGGAPQAARTKFHAPYIIPIRDSVIQEIQILTEFRRTVQAAEDALAHGDWAIAHGTRSLGGRGIDDIVKPWRRKVTITAILQLDPLHAYVGVPDCELMLGGTPAATALDRRTTPRSTIPYSRHGTMTTSLVGAVIETDFDAEALGQTLRPTTVRCDGKDVARATIDFGRLE